MAGIGNWEFVVGIWWEFVVGIGNWEFGMRGGTWDFGWEFGIGNSWWELGIGISDGSWEQDLPVGYTKILNGYPPE